MSAISLIHLGTLLIFTGFLGDGFLVFLYFVFMPLTLALLFTILVSDSLLELEDCVRVRSSGLGNTSAGLLGPMALGVDERS